MKVIKNRNGGRTLCLSEEEARNLWCLVREGRRAMAQEYAAYEDEMALDLLHDLPSDGGHAKRMGDFAS